MPGLDPGEAEAAGKQPEAGDHDEKPERRHDTGPLRHAAPERQGRDGEEQQREEIDAPAFLRRIEAVDELAKPRLDEDPAGAAGRAVGAGRADKIGVENGPADDRHQHDDEQRDAGERNHGVEGRGEIALAQAPDEGRRGPAHGIGGLNGTLGHRLTSWVLALYQFMKPETARPMPR